MSDDQRHGYKHDPAAWSATQADALRRHAYNELDLENIADEIEQLGLSDKHEIYSRLVVVVSHMLKWQFQPTQRSPSWRASIREGRYRIARLIRVSPSLASYPGVCLDEAYVEARAHATDETGIPNLPRQCPWLVEQVLDPQFWPEAAQKL
jgi:Domain of unknown function DUF29